MLPGHLLFIDTPKAPCLWLFLVRLRLPFRYVFDSAWVPVHFFACPKKRTKERAPGICQPFGYPRLHMKNGRDVAALSHFSCLPRQSVERGDNAVYSTHGWVAAEHREAVSVARPRSCGAIEAKGRSLLRIKLIPPMDTFSEVL